MEMDVELVRGEQVKRKVNALIMISITLISNNSHRALVIDFEGGVSGPKLASK